VKKNPAASGFSWGGRETRFFYELTPDSILDAVEEFGLHCTGRCLALNSMENRVLEVEIESDSGEVSQVVAKFYRPGRWSEEQILDEHDFLFDLQDNELTVVAPLRDPDGESLRMMNGVEIWFAVFPRVGGRNPDELSDHQLERVGRLLARVHNTGAQVRESSRLTLNAESYGRESLAYLQESGALPSDIRRDYSRLVEEICDLAGPIFESVSRQRVHGDCHLGNLLWRMDSPYLVDFDDTVMGPCVQDIWLLTPGRDEEALRQRRVLIEGYETMREFDRRELALVEPLRALRYIHFSAWVAKRWQDPAFPRAFPHFAEKNYWREQLMDLEESLGLMQTGGES